MPLEKTWLKGIIRFILSRGDWIIVNLPYLCYNPLMSDLVNENKKIVKVLMFCLMCSYAVALSSCVSTRFFGEETTIQMKGNPTTGYNWFYEISDESIIAVEENVKYLGDDMIVGAPSMFTYTIIALKPGQTTLHFEYKRPWETVEPIETKDYYVTVAENGKITIKE